MVKNDAKQRDHSLFEAMSEVISLREQVAQEELWAAQTELLIDTQQLSPVEPDEAVRRPGRMTVQASRPETQRER